jgi:DNA-binding response OmpR family regulator
LQLAKDNKPDVILLDLAMPNMDGFEFMVHLQANPQTVDIPIIVSSANVLEENRQQSLQAGAAAFIPKPLQRDEIISMLGSLLKIDWTRAESDKKSVSSIAEVETSVVNGELVIPSPDVLQQLYHLAMMGDIPAIEEILQAQIDQDKNLIPFATELTKLTTNFQTGKIRKLIKSLVAEEIAK